MLDWLALLLLPVAVVLVCLAPAWLIVRFAGPGDRSAVLVRCALAVALAIALVAITAYGLVMYGFASLAIEGKSLQGDPVPPHPEVRARLAFHTALLVVSTAAGLWWLRRSHLRRAQRPAPPAGSAEQVAGDGVPEPGGQGQ